MLAQRWHTALGELQSVTVVANADDPLVTWATQPLDQASEAHSPQEQSPQEQSPQDGASRRVLYVAAGDLWHEDATGCPACGGRITFAPGGGWSCECGFARPEVYASLTPAGLEFADGRVLPINLSMPARCNRANAAIAAVAASVMGTDAADALAAMSSVREVEGRFSTIRIDGVTTRLLLAKNPAGWAELLDLLEGSDQPVVVGINSRIADGHDPSWLWDVALGNSPDVSSSPPASGAGTSLCASSTRDGAQSRTQPAERSSRDRVSSGRVRRQLHGLPATESFGRRSARSYAK